MSEKLSVAIITRNEEAHIGACLSSVAWADEIVVVDGGSSDRTLEICRDSQASWASKIKLLERPWNGFREQRTFAMDKAQHDWIFVIDSDERCSPELRDRLQALLAAPGGPPIRAYKVHRQEYFLGKPIFHGCWNPSYQDRFFHRKGVYYKNDIHEYPIFAVEPGRIEEVIFHDPDFSPDKFLRKMNTYTSIEAKDRVQAGQRTHFWRILFSGPNMFLRNYFYYKAYRDGIHGFVISVLEGVSRAVRHVKIWQYSRERRS